MKQMDERNALMEQANFIASAELIIANKNSMRSSYKKPIWRDNSCICTSELDFKSGSKFNITDFSFLSDGATKKRLLKKREELLEQLKRGIQFELDCIVSEYKDRYGSQPSCMEKLKNWVFGNPNCK